MQLLLLHKHGSIYVQKTPNPPAAQSQNFYSRTACNQHFEIDFKHIFEFCFYFFSLFCAIDLTMVMNQRVVVSQNVSLSILLMVAAVCCMLDVSCAFQRQPALFRSANVAVASSSTDTDASSLSNNIIHNRGDSRGAALLMEGVSIFRGPERIIKSIDWRVEPRTKWALVGTNGAGKSTLLKAVVGEILHEGKIMIGTKEQVGYLQQSAVAGSSRTVFVEAASGMTEINEAKAEIERAADVADLEALEKANNRFEAIGGYKQDQKVASVLKGLGFTDFEKRCDELSGGWQMRVAFARLLLSEPTLCLMDEPGNHLDAAAKKWLAQYLKNYDGNGAMILVTHDVNLLGSMDHIAEVIPGAGSLQTYKSCNYEEFLELKQLRAEAAITEYEKNSVKAAKLQGFVDRFGASATKASAAQSRVKALEKMDKQGLLDAPAEDLVAERFKPTLILPKPPKSMGDVLLSLTDADIGYEGKTLVSNVNLEITRGMKLLIRGPNGAGKVCTTSATVYRTVQYGSSMFWSRDVLPLCIFVGRMYATHRSFSLTQCLFPLSLEYCAALATRHVASAAWRTQGKSDFAIGSVYAGFGTRVEPKGESRGSCDCVCSRRVGRRHNYHRRYGSRCNGTTRTAG
jgi:ATP-binding cassette subfamily F protein 3